MALPVFFLPDRLFEPDVGTDVSDGHLEQCRAEWSALQDEVRTTRPTAGSEEERSVLSRFVRLGGDVVTRVGDHWTDAMREGLDRCSRELLETGLSSEKQAQRIAARQLEPALETLNLVLELFELALEQIPEEQHLSALNQLSQLPDALDEPHARDVLRWELDLLVSLELLDGPVEELSYWAARALAGSHRVKALIVADLTGGLRGDIAQLRARNSWTAWDSEEVERELAPWPSPHA